MRFWTHENCAKGISGAVKMHFCWYSFTQRTLKKTMATHGSCRWPLVCPIGRWRGSEWWARASEWSLVCSGSGAGSWSRSAASWCQTCGHPWPPGAVRMKLAGQQGEKHNVLQCSLLNFVVVFRTEFYKNNTAVSWRPTGSLFASECQVVVAGHVVPLAVLVPYHHHAVLPRLEEAVRLVRPPVVILLPLVQF